MAYRNLEDGDGVRIVNGSDYHGCNGVVTEAGDALSRVKAFHYKHGHIYTWVKNDRLIITSFVNYNENWQHPFEVPQPYHENDDDEQDEPCGSCECCYWHANN